MADNVELNPGVGGATIATDDIGGIQHELVKLEFGDDGVATMVSATNPLPVTMSQDIEIGAVELKNGTDDTRAVVTSANALKVDGSAVTQPISAASLPLPLGATIDATSTFVIEGDENAIYVLGNNAVTMYKYSISANTWATVAPTVARAGAPIAGMSADWVGTTGDSNWGDITDIKDGRYIYSLRGGTSVLDRFDISGGTAGAGAWAAVTYLPSLQTFATGDSTEWSGQYIYIAKEGTAAIPQRFYKYDLIGNTVFPLTTDWYLAGAAVIGNKIWVKNLSTEGIVKWLYCLQSTSSNLRRIMLY